VRIIMGLREFFRSRRAAAKSGSSGRSASRDSTAPKNGRLTVAVVAVIVLMLVLAALNVRLILDPSIAGKAFGPWVPSRPATDGGQASSPSCPTPGTATNPAPPQVTFYSKLVAQEEQTRCPEASGSDHAVHREGTGAPHKGSPSEEGSPSDQHTAKKAKGHASPKTKEPVGHVPAETSLPGPDSGTGTYMVQVGAFTNPGIAQQWAVRWKSRGYEVLLKPIARPKTGILYRLYLGKFKSQQEADALVERLKAREGITAFRLLVRN
jgi:cell division septation protein DedD